MAVKKGETISGEIYVAPNKKNKRDLDIEIDFELKGELSQVKEHDSYRMC